MAMGRPEEFGRLPASQALGVDDVCRRFEADWRAGGPRRSNVT